VVFDAFRRVRCRHSCPSLAVLAALQVLENWARSFRCRCVQMIPRISRGSSCIPEHKDSKQDKLGSQCCGGSRTIYLRCIQVGFLELLQHHELVQSRFRKVNERLLGTDKQIRNTHRTVSRSETTTTFVLSEFLCY
jgi:hypothetical protein